MLIILESSWPCELGVTSEKKEVQLVGVIVLFSTSAENVFEQSKHSQKLSLDSIKLQPMTT